jgi:hypothetical protein
MKKKSANKKHSGFGASLYRENANALLNDLAFLLNGLGISAKFKISKVKTSDVSLKTKGNRIAYAFGIGEILSRWHHDSKYLDSKGLPKSLKISGRGTTFGRLVRTCLPGESTDEVLRALRRTGAITISVDNLVAPLRRNLTVFADRDLAAHHTFVALKGVVRTMKHNLLSRPTNVEQRFHRIAWSGDLQRSDIRRLKIWVNNHGQTFLESADDWMKLAPVKNTKSRRTSAARACVGVYLDIDSD